MTQAKKILGLLLALVLVLAMAAPAFAAEGTASITISGTATVPVSGKTFNAYKILDVASYTAANGDTPASVVYTVPAGMRQFYIDRYKGLTGNEGDFDAQVVKKISEETDLFAFAAAAKGAAGSATGTVTAGETDTTAVIPNLPLGYYVIEDVGSAKPISALMLDTVGTNVPVTIKADAPSVDKNIDGSKDTDGATTGDVKNNNSAVGDTVPYKVTTKVPDMTSYKKYYFVLTDTLSKGLTYDKDSVSIKISKAGKGTKDLTADDFTATCTENENADNTLKIVFKDFLTKWKDWVGADITITYTAKINKYAEIGETGNPNSVTLTYSNDPTTQGEGTPGQDEPGENEPTGITPPSVTKTFVTGVKLIKVDPAGNTLTGAEFKITGEKTNIVLVSGQEFVEDANGTHWLLKDGTYTTDDPNAEGMDTSKYQSTTTKYALKAISKQEAKTKESVTAKAYVDANGVLQFDGLSVGTYTITEMKAPNGYNLLEKPIEVTIGFTAPAEGENKCTWTYAWKEQGGKNLTAVAGAANTLQVVNQAGGTLPSTGGIGTTIFYTAGGILVLAAVVLLITKRRVNAEK